MSLSKAQWEFLKDVAKLITYAQEQELMLTGGELWRSDAQHALNLKEGKSQAKHSDHQDRLAIDFNLFVAGEIQWSKNEHWEKLGSFWKSLHSSNEWGGDYKTLHDPYHFARKYKRGV